MAATTIGTKEDLLPDESAQRIAEEQEGLSRLIRREYVRSLAAEGAVFLAHDMGLRLTRVLSAEDIVALMLAGDLGDTPTNVLRSFRNADLVMEAVDESGADCCVAVEVSYTADGRDTTRAVRNAGLLARLSGQADSRRRRGLPLRQQHPRHPRVGRGFLASTRPRIGGPWRGVMPAARESLVHA